MVGPLEFWATALRHLRQKVCWQVGGMTGSAKTSMQIEQTRCYEMRLLSTNKRLAKELVSSAAGFFSAAFRLCLGGIFLYLNLSILPAIF